jgi:anti-anti-sigma factor
MTEPAAFHGGYYDANRIGELAAELDAISPHSDVVIDLASTEYLDCSSLGLMVRHVNRWRLQKPGTKLRLINVNERLVTVMHALGLDRVFVINHGAGR